MGLLLQVHDWWRWAVLILAVIVLVKSLLGWLGKRPFTKLDDQLGQAYTVAFDIQVLVGLILWVFGPMGLRTLSQSMSNSQLRFIVVEHGVLAILALVFAHVGRSRSKNAKLFDEVRHRSAFIFYLLSFIALALIWLLPMMMGG
jgi:hypothetical protein